jgi:hypothetical protein
MYTKTSEEELYMDTIEALIESFKTENPIDTLISNSINKNKFYWGYNESPFFTDIEIEQLKNYYAESSNESYHDYFDNKDESATAITYSNSDPYKSYSSRIKELQCKVDLSKSEDEINECKQRQIDLGWNPEIEYTAESQSMARNRFIDLMTESMCKTDIIDIKSFIENYNDNEEILTESIHSSLHPVSIVLVRTDAPVAAIIAPVTNSKYTHAALALDGNFNKLYSYNMINKVNATGGFSLESMKEYPKNNDLAVYTFFVDDKDYNALQGKIQYLLNNIKTTTYNIFTFITYPFRNINISTPNSMMCSQFVDSCLRLINVNITNKTYSSKVSPADLQRGAAANKATVYETFVGKVKDFNENKVKKYLYKLANKFNSNINEDYVGSDVPLILTEARKSHIEIKDNGDVLLTNPYINYDSEYQASHKLLLQYEKVNNIEGMKYELARLYYMNYILEKRIYSNSLLFNKENNIKTRARILNDFNKYIKIVLKAQPNFNFAEYYEASQFYPHTVEVKASTITKLKDIFNYIL